MCLLGTTGYAKDDFPVFSFCFLRFWSVSFGKKTRWQRTIEKATLQCLLVCTGPGTLRAFPRGACYLRSSPKKMENKKKNQPRRDPGLRKHLTLGENIGSGGCMGLLHFSIWTFFLVEWENRARVRLCGSGCQLTQSSEASLEKNERTDGGWSEAVKRGLECCRPKQLR